MRGQLYFVPALLALAAGVSAGEAATGSLGGGVLDQGKKPPNGLSGAKVRLRLSDGKLTEPVITDSDGRYRIDNVPTGEHTLVVTKTGYIPRPYERTRIKVDGAARADDVQLMQAYGSSAYYATVAAGIAERVASAGRDDQPRALTGEWEFLRAINLPPSSKALLARELDKKDTRAKEMLPDFKSYLAAEPDAIVKAQAQFGQALAGKDSLPAKASLGDMKLSDDVVADVVLFQVKGSTEPPARRKAFVSEFLLKWDDTRASRRFLKLQKSDSERGPAVIPPE